MEKEKEEKEKEEEGKKTEDDNSSSGGKTKTKTKTTVILLKQLCFQKNDEIEDEDERFFNSMPHIIEHPRLAWTLLTWDGSLEGISLLSTLYQDHEKAREANRGDGDEDNSVVGKGFGIVGMLPYPKRFGSTCGNTLAVCNSRIYFIGGAPLIKPSAFSKQVLCFDPTRQKWNFQLPRLNKPRHCHVTATVGDVIYVFGDADFRPTRITPHYWGEYLDTRIKGRAAKWKRLPHPPSEIYKRYQPTSHAVYRSCQAFTYTTHTPGDNNKSKRHKVKEKQDLILLLNDEPGRPISVFNCTTHEWLPDMHPPDPTEPENFPYCPRHVVYQDRFAVLHGVLIWHHLGIFHGYDLVNQEFLEFPFSRNFRTNVPVYLVQQGEDKLLILCEAPMDPSAVDCRLFQVKQDHPSFHLQYMGYRNIDTMDQFQLQDACVLCDK